VTKDSSQDPTRTALIILCGAIVFGALMGVRQDVSQSWARVAIAGVAGGVMGWVLSRVTKRRAGGGRGSAPR